MSAPGGWSSLRRRRPRERGRPHVAAQFATPEAINFMAKHGRGLDLPGAHRRAAATSSGLALMAANNKSPLPPPSPSRSRRARASPRASRPTIARTPSTWRSTPTRARATWSSPATSSRCWRRTAACSARGPYRGRGRSRAPGGAQPAGVICEMMNDDGTMARLPELVRYCARTRPEDGHRRRPDRLPPPHEKLVRREAEARLPTELRRVHVSSTARSWTTSTTWRWSAARSTGGATCWCACTPSA